MSCKINCTEGNDPLTYFRAATLELLLYWRAIGRYTSPGLSRLLATVIAEKVHQVETNKDKFDRLIKLTMFVLAALTAATAVAANMMAQIGQLI